MAEGALTCNEIDEAEAIRMHSHGYDFKKRGGFIRIQFRKWTGRSVPDYGYTIGHFTFSRYLMEIIISTMFILLSLAPSRWLVEQFSPKFVGNLFERTRTLWKKSTHSIKRKDL
jgi:hypothetical protein